MSSEEHPSGDPPEAVLATIIAAILLWIFAYNIAVHDMGPIAAFFRILDGVNELATGLLTLTVLGTGIVTVFTVTHLFTQSMTNLYSMRIGEELVREHLFRGDLKGFVNGLIRLNEQPLPDSPLPKYISSALFVLALHYLLAWIYLVVFSECLWFAAWSAGVYLDLYPETMNIVPLFAVAVPFTARLMAWLGYPYADDYASFIPGILFVVVLLLAFVGYMGGTFDYFMYDIYNREVEGFFSRGALFWKFLRDGCMVALYPVVGEIVFLYLQYKDLKERETMRQETLAALVALEEAEFPVSATEEGA